MAGDRQSPGSEESGKQSGTVPCRESRGRTEALCLPGGLPHSDPVLLEGRGLTCRQLDPVLCLPVVDTLASPVGGLQLLGDRRPLRYPGARVEEGVGEGMSAAVA